MGTYGIIVKAQDCLLPFFNLRKCPSFIRQKENLVWDSDVHSSLSESIPYYLKKRLTTRIISRVSSSHVN